MRSHVQIINLFLKHIYITEGTLHCFFTFFLLFTLLQMSPFSTSSLWPSPHCFCVHELCIFVLWLIPLPPFIQSCLPLTYLLKICIYFYLIFLKDIFKKIKTLIFRCYLRTLILNLIIISTSLC